VLLSMNSMSARTAGSSPLFASFGGPKKSTEKEYL